MTRFGRVLVVVAVVAAGACGSDDPDLVAFTVAGDNPVDGTLWCPPGDIVADLTSTTAVPPNISVPALPEDEAEQKAEAFIDLLFADRPAASADRRLDHDGGPNATMALFWPGRAEPRAGGWLTFALVEGDWAVTGYTVCNRFAFGD